MELKINEIYEAIPKRNLNAIMIIQITDPRINELSVITKVSVLYSNDECQVLGWYIGTSSSLVIRSWNLKRLV
jgi:hypothetical protein